MKLDDGLILASLEEIHEGAVAYFQKFFMEQTNREQSNLRLLISKYINQGR